MRSVSFIFFSFFWFVYTGNFSTFAANYAVRMFSPQIKIEKV